MPGNKLIVLEGLDGSGKSTQVDLIKEYFEANNMPYSYFHFPMYGKNQFSQIISAFLRGEYGEIDKVDPYFIATQYAMDQWEFRSELKKALENGHVLLDRYVFSNIAYQGAKMETHEEAREIRQWIYELSFNFLKMPYPDFTIFFDVAIETIKKRLEIKKDKSKEEYLKGKDDIHEANIDYQLVVRQNYIELAGYNGYKILACQDKNLNIYNPIQLFFHYSDMLSKVLINES